MDILAADLSQWQNTDRKKRDEELEEKFDGEYFHFSELVKVSRAISLTRL